MSRTVICVKLKKEAEGLAAAPFAGPLGQEIYEKVSKEAWEDWKDNMMIKVINEYRLNLVDPNHYQTLLKQMSAYLGLSGDKILEVENAERGKS
ncbi:oxidative damage protection protein [bacterium]|nr:oxidative damage protection protein [bacterium]